MERHRSRLLVARLGMKYSLDLISINSGLRMAGTLDSDTQTQESIMSNALPSSASYPDQLAHIQGQMGALSKAAPDTMKGFGALHKAAVSNGALDTKTKELIALAIAVSARCDGCVAFHTHDVLEAGATPEEITEALGVAVLMGGGPAVMYATHVLDAVKQFQAGKKG